MRADGAIEAIDVGSRALSEPGDLFIVEFIEPLEPNRSALGLDIASESVRCEALYRACELRKPIVSGRIRLVQEADSKYGTLVIARFFFATVPHRKQERRSEITSRESSWAFTASVLPSRRR